MSDTESQDPSTSGGPDRNDPVPEGEQSANPFDADGDPSEQRGAGAEGGDAAPPSDGAEGEIDVTEPTSSGEPVHHVEGGDLGDGGD